MTSQADDPNNTLRRRVLVDGPPQRVERLRPRLRVEVLRQPADDAEAADARVRLVGRRAELHRLRDLGQRHVAEARGVEHPAHRVRVGEPERARHAGTQAAPDLAALRDMADRAAAVAARRAER